eukprot:g1412.t1
MLYHVPIALLLTFSESVRATLNKAPTVQHDDDGPLSPEFYASGFNVVTSDAEGASSAKVPSANSGDRGRLSASSMPSSETTSPHDRAIMPPSKRMTAEEFKKLMANRRKLIEVTRDSDLFDPDSDSDRGNPTFVRTPSKYGLLGVTSEEEDEEEKNDEDDFEFDDFEDDADQDIGSVMRRMDSDSRMGNSPVPHDPVHSKDDGGEKITGSPNALPIKADDISDVLEHRGSMKDDLEDSKEVNHESVRLSRELGLSIGDSFRNFEGFDSKKIAESAKASPIATEDLSDILNRYGSVKEEDVSDSLQQDARESSLDEHDSPDAILIRENQKLIESLEAERLKSKNTKGMRGLRKRMTTLRGKRIGGTGKKKIIEKLKKEITEAEERILQGRALAKLESEEAASAGALPTSLHHKHQRPRRNVGSVNNRLHGKKKGHSGSM